jgi:hypothetical protein
VCKQTYLILFDEKKALEDEAKADGGVGPKAEKRSHRLIIAFADFIICIVCLPFRAAAAEKKRAEEEERKKLAAEKAAKKKAKKTDDGDEKVKEVQLPSMRDYVHGVFMFE